LGIFKELLKTSEIYVLYYADTLYELGALYNTIGKHDAAEKCFIESKSIYKQLTEKKIKK
jgi:hypothetical protein